MEQDVVVRACGLRRSYGDFVAVDGIDFEIRRGEFFGFLGPNGAGKTTTMRMLYRASGLDGGSLEILGVDASTTKNDRMIKARVGVVPQEDNLDQEMTVAENLDVFARFYGFSKAERKERVEAMILFADLDSKRNELVETLSGGMKRRLMVARGLLGSPDLFVLDEPSTGLDPRARQRIWERLAELRRQKITVILTTHYMEEAERLCDRIAIMDAGKIVAMGTPKSLIKDHVPAHVVEIRLGYDQDISIVDPLRGDALRVEELNDRVLFYTDDPQVLLAHAADLVGVQTLVRLSSLDDVFLRITGHGLGHE
jgi:lipooligosaccharide transport system ATP-binding protein